MGNSSGDDKDSLPLPTPTVDIGAVSLTMDEMPQWRFIAKAKKTEGYSSASAGRVVEGLSARELAAKYEPSEYTNKPNNNSRVIGKLELDDDDVDEIDETYTCEVDKKGAPLIEETNEGGIPSVEQVETNVLMLEDDIEHDKDEQESGGSSSEVEFSKVGAHDKTWELYHRHRLLCLGALLLLLFLAIAIPVAITLAHRPTDDTNSNVKLSIDNVTSKQEDLSNALQACVCSTLIDRSNEGTINSIEGITYQCIKDDHVTTNQLTRQPGVTLCVYPSDELVLDGYRLGNELKKLTMTVMPSNSTTNNTKYDLLNQDEDGGRYSFDMYKNATGKVMTLNISLSLPHVSDYFGSIVEVCSSVALIPIYQHERRGYEIKVESDADDGDPRRGNIDLSRMLQDLSGEEEEVASFCLPIAFDVDHSSNSFESSDIEVVSLIEMNSTLPPTTTSGNDVKGCMCKVSKRSAFVESNPQAPEQCPEFPLVSKQKTNQVTLCIYSHQNIMDIQSLVLSQENGGRLDIISDGLILDPATARANIQVDGSQQGSVIIKLPSYFYDGDTAEANVIALGVLKVEDVDKPGTVGIDGNNRQLEDGYSLTTEVDFAIPFTVKTRPSALMQSNNNNDLLASSESNQDSQSLSQPFVETVSKGPNSQSSSQPFIEPSPPQVESSSQVQSSSQVFVEPSSSPSLQPIKKPYQSSTASQLFVEVEPLLSLQPNKKPSPPSITSQVFVEPSTTQPTLRPTTKVTRSPSTSPLATLSTYSPSDDPSQAPTVEPTGSPNYKPTSLSPTNLPSLMPTYEPTIQPSSKPDTPNPTRKPSKIPSRQPSKNPVTSKPTTKPSIKPTTKPSIKPNTPNPTRQPSRIPSRQPSKNPVTSKPTTKPSTESISPSRSPSKFPSVSPSMRPSAGPTASPSKEPSQSPSKPPSRSPSKMPSKEPSQNPSKSPSRSPNKMPSKVPTSAPSSNPSNVPSISPSKGPSVSPSKAPSKEPTQSPSLSPSRTPSKMPSVSPSTNPTTAPTSKPTLKCFGADDGSTLVLRNAVQAYVSQGCTTNQQCLIAQIYGWPMNSWCVGSVKSMATVFSGMDTFNEDISDWDTSSVTSMWLMFNGASSFNGDLSNFDTSSVTDMGSMFDSATSFNGDLSNFDTSSVTNMEKMFRGASSFNGDVSNFDTSSVYSMKYMFDGASSFNSDLFWDTSSVTDMSYMFKGATAFNGDVSKLDTSSVTLMEYMFERATSFNQDVSIWNTSKVVDMTYMFYDAADFNQNLCAWKDSPAVTYGNSDGMFGNSQGKPSKDCTNNFDASQCV